MPKITFIQANGETKVVDAEIGKSVMEAAVRNGISGIPADCGGACSCATCHCYIDDAFFDQLTPASADELDMLEFADNIQANSRLTCQIKMQDQFDGLVVTIPNA